MWTNVPLQFDVRSGAGVLWKAAVPASGHNSPIVWDSSVVNPGKDDRLGIAWATVSIANGKLCTMGSKEGSCFVFCPDEQTGKLDWKERGLQSA